MASPNLDDEIHAFIDAAIPSVWALELLVLLRTSPDLAWTEAGLVLELRASAPLVSDLLDALHASGLIVRLADGVRYQPVSPTLDRLCAALEATYRERPVSVIRAITGRKSSQLKGFADSFRVKGWRP